MQTFLFLELIIHYSALKSFFIWIWKKIMFFISVDSVKNSEKYFWVVTKKYKYIIIIAALIIINNNDLLLIFYYYVTLKFIRI